MNTKKISLQGLDKTWDKLKELIIIIIVLYLKNILFEDPDFLGVWCDADIGGCDADAVGDGHVGGGFETSGVGVSGMIVESSSTTLGCPISASDRYPCRPLDENNNIKNIKLKVTFNCLKTLIFIINITSFKKTWRKLSNQYI